MIPVSRRTPETRSRYVARRGVVEGRVRETVEEILREFRKDPDGTIRR